MLRQDTTPATGQLSLSLGTAEEWRAVAGYEGYYEVSGLGRVRSLPRSVRARSKKGLWFQRPLRGKVLATPTLSAGYPMVTLSQRGKVKGRSVHSLVCEAFHGPRPEGWVCAHRDGNALNNTPANLRWTTYRENNVEDRIRHGRMPRGTAHYAATLTEDTVVAILLADGRHIDIAARFGTTIHIVHDIKRRKTWRHVTDEVTP